ncbi:hypothetical protein QYE76_031375 [Lolium multiflorum]|uniref:CCHC-type domain-containing protein n=1 Tax=Lolium multiflorum TaxID=4521 RepID=A0AAD8QS21_LOLMU|nr:hypothetical protein QYE76_031375 [Lolium multiflorum]
MFKQNRRALGCDDWLQTIENNLEVAGVEAAEKYCLPPTTVRTCKSLWTSARAMNAGQMMTWEDFKLKFSKYHVPQGLIKKMRDEFRELKQGRMSVVEYRDRFLTLSSNNHGGPPKPGGNNNGNNTNTNTGPRTGSNAIPVTPKDKSTINCYECGVVGHYSKECPKKLAKIAANPAAPAQQQRRFASRRNQNNNNGRFYHMTATEAQEAPRQPSPESPQFEARSRRSPQILAIDPRLPKLRHCTRSLSYLANVASNLAIDLRRPTAPSDPLGTPPARRHLVGDDEAPRPFDRVLI